jgi:hypothetical protein
VGGLFPLSLSVSGSHCTVLRHGYSAKVCKNYTFRAGSSYFPGSIRLLPESLTWLFSMELEGHGKASSNSASNDSSNSVRQIRRRRDQKRTS